MIKHYILIIGFTFGSYSLFGQQELIANGSFESGEQSWDFSLAPNGFADVGSCLADDGQNYLWFGDFDELTGIDNIDYEEVIQTISLPSNLDFAEFSFSWSGTSDELDDVNEWDFLYFGLFDVNGDAIFIDSISNADLNPLLAVDQCDDWFGDVGFTLDSQYAGQDIDVLFSVFTDDLNPTIFRIDNVSVLAFTTAGLTEAPISLLEISPNPANEVIRVLNSSSNNNITILNSEGREIGAFTLTSGINEINISDFSQGLYFIKETNGAVTKIVKE